jgi:hypothetical protein
VGNGGPQAGVGRHQPGPVRGEALEVLDARPQRRIAPQRERFEERQLALALGSFGREELDRLRRSGRQVRRAGLDQEEQSVGAPGRQAGPYLVRREELVGRRARSRGHPLVGHPSTPPRLKLGVVLPMIGRVPAVCQHGRPDIRA